MLRMFLDKYIDFLCVCAVCVYSTVQCPITISNLVRSFIHLSIIYYKTYNIHLALENEMQPQRLQIANEIIDIDFRYKSSRSSFPAAPAAADSHKNNKFAYQLLLVFCPNFNYRFPGPINYIIGIIVEGKIEFEENTSADPHLFSI